MTSNEKKVFWGSSVVAGLILLCWKRASAEPEPSQDVTIDEVTLSII